MSLKHGNYANYDNVNNLGNFFRKFLSGALKLS